jgi:hypothetical protein
MAPMNEDGIITPLAADEQDGGTLVPQIEVATEDTELPKFDFGAGELADKVKALKEKLGMLPDVSPKRDDEGEKSNDPEAKGTPIKGDSLDWTEFDLRPDIAHLYPQSQVVDTPQGPKWAVMLDEFMTREKNVNPLFDKDGRFRRNEKTGEAMDMGTFVTETLVEAPEQGCTTWKLVAFMPGSMTGMCQVIMQRKKQVALPDPMLLPKPEDTVVEPPVDQELATVEAAAAEWAGEPAPETPYTSVDTDGAVEGA